MISLPLLESELNRLNIRANPEIHDQFIKYAEILVDWNRRMNLTSITDPDGIVYRHFADSAALLNACEIPHGSSLIDVGTGAGFPGVVLKILRPDIRITLLDAQRKRTEFLRALLDSLGLEGEILHSRGEEAARSSKFREAFDFSVARAVADMRILSELCLPFPKIGGCFIAMKGPDIQLELDSSKSAVKILGGRIDAVKPAVLGDSSGRNFIIIKKISQTPPKYPRNFGKITKSPL